MISIPPITSRYRSLVNCQHHQHYVVKARKNVIPISTAESSDHKKKTDQIERSSDKPKKLGSSMFSFPKSQNHPPHFSSRITPPTPKEIGGQHRHLLMHHPTAQQKQTQLSLCFDPTLRSRPDDKKGVSHVYLR